MEFAYKRCINIPKDDKKNFPLHIAATTRPVFIIQLIQTMELHMEPGDTTSSAPGPSL